MGWRPRWCAVVCGNRRCKHYLATLHPQQPESTSTNRRLTSLMSIRMPLEHTVRPAATPRRSIQRVGLALLALLMVTALASCATGNKSDATFYENRDATVQSQMPDVQATTTARFFGGTPTAIATYAPVPALAELTLATSVGGDGSPQNRVKNASGGTIYASARIRNIVSGQVYTAVWGRPDGTEIERVDQTAA